MENVAHTVAGLLLAEGALAIRHARTGAAPSPGLVRAALWTSAIANNLPDADVVLGPTMPAPLGYLLHHRGHTHTVVVGLVLGALVAAVAIGLGRWRAGPPHTGEARWLAGLALAGPLVHLAMDGLNVYGVHPFWPVWNGWLYGDLVFIVEPLFWTIGLPVLVARARSRLWRVALIGLIAAGVTLPWLVPGFVPLGSRLALLATLVAFGLVAARARPGVALALAIAGCVATVVVFAIAGAAARSTFADRLARGWPDERTHDLSLSALPANPLCWSAIGIRTGRDGALVLRRATVTAWPAVLAAGACPALEDRPTLPLSRVDARSDARLAWQGEWRAPLAELRELAGEHCHAAAFLRFARAPFWLERADGVVLGDLRFDRSPSLEFAEMLLPRRPGRCPEGVPGWTPPLGPLLSPSERAQAR